MFELWNEEVYIKERAPYSIKLGVLFYIKKPRFLMNTLCIPINNYINVYKFSNWFKLISYFPISKF